MKTGKCIVNILEEDYYEGSIGKRLYYIPLITNTTDAIPRIINIFSPSGFYHNSFLTIKHESGLRDLFFRVL